jgi:NhaP-type Na+/H+ and K+/H+ antiporter
MFNCWRLPLISAAFLAFSFSIGATSFLVKPETVAAQQAQQTFPDVPPNYWARPFIQSLAEKGIVTIYIFVLLGLALPWQQWLELGWKGLLLAVAVLLLRRPPAFLLLRPLLGQLKSWQDTLFLGWFGPIGAAAIFYAMLALRKTGLESAWVIGSLIICASIIAHGFTAVPLAKAYPKMQRKRQTSNDLVGR